MSRRIAWFAAIVTLAASYQLIPASASASVRIIVAHPYFLHDPAWKVCQIEGQHVNGAPYWCIGHSYFPYGLGGYRPYGTYRPYSPRPVYGPAPNAKIISIDRSVTTNASARN